VHQLVQARVERDSSTINRILTDLQNRLKTEQLIKISIEGPSDLDNDLKDLIIDSWKSKKLRRISVLFSFEVFLHNVSVTEEKKVVVLRKINK
jgi:hypothetical protein